MNAPFIHMGKEGEVRFKGKFYDVAIGAGWFCLFVLMWLFFLGFDFLILL